MWLDPAYLYGPGTAETHQVHDVADLDMCGSIRGQFGAKISRSVEKRVVKQIRGWDISWLHRLY